MGWPPWCCFRHEPAYKKVDAEDPAQYVSARLESEFDQVKNFPMSLYRKVSEWSLPKKEKKVNLFTMNEAEHEHDFLLDEPGGSSSDVEPENDVEHFSRPKHTVSSIYDKVSDWSFPDGKTHTKLSTVREEEDHESLMDKYSPQSPCSSCDGPSPSPSSPPQNLPDFDDVVDEIV